MEGKPLPGGSPSTSTKSVTRKEKEKAKSVADMNSKEFSEFRQRPIFGEASLLDSRVDFYLSLCADDEEEFPLQTKSIGTDHMEKEPSYFGEGICTFKNYLHISQIVGLPKHCYNFQKMIRFLKSVCFLKECTKFLFVFLQKK